MRKIKMTYAIAMAAARDAGNRSMRAGKRTKWAVGSLRGCGRLIWRLSMSRDMFNNDLTKTDSFGTPKPQEDTKRYQGLDSGLKTPQTANKRQIGTGECILDDCFCHDVQHAFDHKWRQAPKSMKRTTEYETAAYWCEVGRQLERGELVELIESDLHELLRIVKERL